MEINEKELLIEILLSKFQYFLGKFYKNSAYIYIYMNKKIHLDINHDLSCKYHTIRSSKKLRIK